MQQPFTWERQKQSARRADPTTTSDTLDFCLCRDLSLIVNPWRSTEEGLKTRASSEAFLERGWSETYVKGSWSPPPLAVAVQPLRDIITQIQGQPEDLHSCSRIFPS